MPTYSLAAEVLGRVVAFALVAAAVAGLTLALEAYRRRRWWSALGRRLEHISAERREDHRG